MMEPVATCVVDSAIPKCEDVRIMAADDISAAMPCGESISTSPLPRVRMTRQPPIQVPTAMAMAQAAFTQKGIVASW